MTECKLARDPVEMSFVSGPVSERRSEAMDRGTHAHVLGEKPIESLVVDGVFAPGGLPDMAIAADLSLLSQQFYCPFRQRDPMLTSGFSSLSGHGPKLVIEVDFRPLHTDNLASPARGQQQKLDDVGGAERRVALLLYTEQPHEVRYLCVIHRGIMLPTIGSSWESVPHDAPLSGIGRATTNPPWHSQTLG
jgi:hypothetical protein